MGHEKHHIMMEQSRTEGNGIEQNTSNVVEWYRIALEMP